MKVGVISDIHSNIVAFEAVIRVLEEAGCDEYLFLGDYVSDTPYPRETMDALYAFLETHTCRVLRGNREEYLLSQQRAIREGDTEKYWRYNSASGNLLYTYERLTQRDLAFFESLPISFVYAPEGLPAIRCCHGSPENTRELIQLGSDLARAWLERIPEQYLLCAHTHYPGEYTRQGKHYFNTGCVGISIADAGFAQCMILHGITEGGEAIWKPEFLKVPYDNEKVVRDTVSRGLLKSAPWFVNSNIQILLTGDDHSAELVELAARLSREAGEPSGWPDLKEFYFEQAAAQLGIPDYRKEYGV